MTKLCPKCGIEFQSLWSFKVYCSSRCKRAVDNARRIPLRNRSNYQRGSKVALEYVYNDKITKGCSRCPEHRLAKEATA